MNNITKTIKKLIAEHGLDIIQQEQRIKAILTDLHPNEKRIQYLLELSIHAEIPKKLIAMQNENFSNWVTQANAITHYFKEEYFLDENAVKSVFDCWSEIFPCKSVPYDEFIKKISGAHFATANTKEIQKKTYQDGSFYEGDIVNGKRHGRGILTYPQNDSRDRKSYEGDWISDQRNGHGLCIMKSGFGYKGDWKDDQPHGKGIFTLGEYRYEGDINNGKKNGRGIMTYPDGGRYEGDWKNEKREGKGTFFYPNGSKYEGDWKDDLRHGRGIEDHGRGHIYEGEWINDKKHGIGIQKTRNGNIYKEVWIYGHLERDIIL